MIDKYSVEDNINSGEAVFDTHLHDTYEINFMLTPGIEVVIENKFFLSRRGDIFIFPPYTFHKIDSKGAPFSRFLLFFDESEMQKSAAVLSPAISFLKSAKPLVVHINEDELPQMTQLFSAAYQNYNADGILNDFNNTVCFGNIISKIIDNAGTSHTGNSDATSNHMLSKILEYVNKNIAQPLTISGVAENFNISTTTLWHIMRDGTGLSLKEYILKIRIAKAMSLLADGLSVTEVSNRTGFNSYAHFIRTFTGKTGISPYQYGKQRRQ